MKRLIIRWTFGETKARKLSPQALDMLDCATKFATFIFKKLFARVEFFICLNNATELTLKKLKEIADTLSIQAMDVSEILPVQLRNINVKNSWWKYAPIRIDKDAYEIVMDNDLIIWKMPETLLWAIENDTLVALTDAAGKYYGSYNEDLELVNNDLKLNAGLLGFPPGFVPNLRPVINNPPADFFHSEQGFSALNFAQYPGSKKLIPLSEIPQLNINSVDPLELISDYCGAHFCGCSYGHFHYWDDIYAKLLETLYAVSSNIKPLDMYSKSTMMESVLSEILKLAKTNLGFEYNQIDLEEFFRAIKTKYPPFHNFRDISLIPNRFSGNMKIKEGLIFRSASLSRYDADRLLQFLKNHQIRYIIDLRPQSEIEYLFREKNRIYPDEILEQYVINIPINAEVDSYTSQNFYRNLYYAILKNNSKQIEELFSNYFVHVGNNKLIIHCEAGKDRTGVTIALLLDLLGVPRAYILEDYCASYSDTDRKNLEFFFDVLDTEYGGSQKYLVSCCNIPESILKTIQRQLVIS